MPLAALAAASFFFCSAIALALLGPPLNLLGESCLDLLYSPTTFWCSLPLGTSLTTLLGTTESWDGLTGTSLPSSFLTEKDSDL